VRHKSAVQKWSQKSMQADRSPYAGVVERGCKQDNI
jgi:hypothetical protein